MIIPQNGIVLIISPWLQKSNQACVFMFNKLKEVCFSEVHPDGFTIESTDGESAGQP